jgi:hypothetical protein
LETTKVVCWADIQAPLQEVYEAILHVERRMQLSPLWGVTELKSVDEDYPQVGSSLCIKLVAPPQTNYHSIITRLVPLKQFAYRLTVNRDTHVKWRFQEVSTGTRLTYEEEFLVEPTEREAFSQSVHEVIQEWLQNIKKYTELRQGRSQRLLKWLLDRFYLHLRPDQRKTVQVILFMHGVGTLASAMAIIAWGIAFALK